MSLRWSQVDLDGGRIDYNTPGARRTNKRRARIPIPAKLLAHLQRARRRGVELGFVVNEGGTELQTLSAALHRHAVGLDFVKMVTPHTLRHTAATWLMQRGVKVLEHSLFLGDVAQTLQRVYGHHHPDYLKSAAEAFG